MSIDMTMGVFLPHFRATEEAQRIVQENAAEWVKTAADLFGQGNPRSTNGLRIAKMVIEWADEQAMQSIDRISNHAGTEVLGHVPEGSPQCSAKRLVLVTIGLVVAYAQAPEAIFSDGSLAKTLGAAAVEICNAPARDPREWHEFLIQNGVVAAPEVPTGLSRSFRTLMAPVAIGSRPPPPPPEIPHPAQFASASPEPRAYPGGMEQARYASAAPTVSPMFGITHMAAICYQQYEHTISVPYQRGMISAAHFIQDGVTILDERRMTSNGLPVGTPVSTSRSRRWTGMADPTTTPHGWVIVCLFATDIACLISATQEAFNHGRPREHEVTMNISRLAAFPVNSIMRLELAAKDLFVMAAVRLDCSIQLVNSACGDFVARVTTQPHPMSDWTTLYPVFLACTRKYGSGGLRTAPHQQHEQRDGRRHQKGGTSAIRSRPDQADQAVGPMNKGRKRRGKKGQN